MMNSKGCGRKRSWSNFMHYPAIYLEVLRKISTDLRQDSRSPRPS